MWTTRTTLLILFGVLTTTFLFISADDILGPKAQTTDLAYETSSDTRLLIFSLLDGSFVAVDRSTGSILWKHRSKAPIVSVPTPNSQSIQPLYVPDPRDGSIYLLSLSAQPVRKLPFTIPELVAASPCRSSDSILYTGSKRDSWLRLDRRTGEMWEVLGWEERVKGDSTCPVDGVNGKFQVYLGKTQYTVLMVDSRNESRRWNVSFSQYNAPPMTTDDLSTYNHLHLTSSSSGHIMTIDRRTGALAWITSDIGAPVVGAYLLDEVIGGLLQVPFTSASAHTLRAISKRGSTNGGEDDPNGGDGWAELLTQQKLYPTLYIGLHSRGGLYAIPSLLERPGLSLSDIGGLPMTSTDGAIADADGPLMLLHSFGGSKNEGGALYLGHYHVPDYVPEQYPLQVLQPTGGGKGKLTSGYITHVQHNKIPSKQDKSKIGHLPHALFPPPPFFTPTPVPVSSLPPPSEHLTVRNLIRYLYTGTKQWLDGQDNKAIKLALIVVVGCVVAMAWYVRMQVQEMRQISQNGSSNSKQQYLSDGTTGADGATISITELLDNGEVRVGKIQFNPNDLLGKGCEGTFVYRGTFDGRQVAVKRLLPECFSLADREVALLRESDAHAHVIRYYCTEQDRLFRYIALELCEATLHDYVTGKWKPKTVKNKSDTSNTTIGIALVKQVLEGVEHLHSLNIVHRDIKPHNVLLMLVPQGGAMRAMISDFGLCKKVAEGHVSFSRRSGITGTDGWMAPEMLINHQPLLPSDLSNQNNRPTLAVDLFSLGCLIYYVLTWGGHPFGEPLHRQANIQSNRYHLNLSETQLLWLHLVSCMLRPKNESHLRPPCHLVLHHPALWHSGKVLEFLQDVSDCVERRCRRESDLLGGTNGKATLFELIHADSTSNSWRGKLEESVVRSDWRAHVDGVVVEDLRKYRTYQGTNVRDLLRAIRNKRNHYRELSAEAQSTLGAPPGAFTQYWTGRFPQLVLYTWLALQNVTNDPSNDNSVRSHYFTGDNSAVEFFPLNRGTIHAQLSERDRQLADKYREKDQEEKLAKELEQQNKKREQVNSSAAGGTPRRKYYNKRGDRNSEKQPSNDDNSSINWRARPNSAGSHNNNVS